MKSYEVLRQHLGDKQYFKGDQRKADEADVKHLIDRGVLREAKSEKAPANKAEKAAPKNKAAE